MIKNHLTVILRSLIRNKVFSLINLLGLSIGLTSFILIGIYVVDEFSFDSHHIKADRIYQITIAAPYNGKIERWNSVPNKTAPTLAKDIPEVEKAFRLLPNNFSGKAFVSSENIKSTETKLVWADATIFDMLTIPFLKGDPKTALTRPHTIVISEASATKYFGTQDVLGKTLKIDKDTVEFEITGVIKNAPLNSRFTFPMIGTFEGQWYSKNLTWDNASFETYLLLHENSDPIAIEKKIQQALERNIFEKDNRWFSLEMHPLKKVHLYYPEVNESSLSGTNGDMSQLKLLMALGAIILVIAAVNYMNLSTAQSQRRFKEIGVSKTLGATSGQLARKFYLETSVFVLLSMLISLMLVFTVLPIFNSIAGKQFSESFFSASWFWISFVLVWFVLTLMAGFYPSLYLSSFSPKRVLKGAVSGVGGNSSLRKVLVVVQFSVSIILIISTIILYQQLNFVKTKKLGYEPEQVVAISTTGAQTRAQVNSLKSVLQGLGSVTSVARAQSYPGRGTSGRFLPPLDGQGEGIMFSTTRATPEVLDVLGIKLLAGKTLPEKKEGDTTIQIIINKTSVDFLGLTPEAAVNKKIKVQGFDEVEIVGVMEDFHFNSLRQPIGGYCFHNAESEGYGFLLVKLQTKELSSSLTQIENEFKKIIPSAFEFTFLDQQLEIMYRSEQQLAILIFLFAGLAIFIACLGLYALAAYTTEQRTKEIGVRKVMGASIWQLSNMLSKDFIKLVAISFVIAAPVAYYGMSQWLQGFTYRIDISILVFLISGFISVLIAWFTVGFESLKAARANPVESLRSE
jgi:putative ABC transport system permease protein